MTTALRNATVADVVKRIQADQGLFQSYAIPALYWGMGDAQHGAYEACARAAKAGLLDITPDGNAVSITEYGKDWTPQPVFTLRYLTPNGQAERVLPAAGIEHVGAVVMRLADRDMATDIEVLDETGLDVTFDFACFC